LDVVPEYTEEKKSEEKEEKEEKEKIVEEETIKTPLHSLFESCFLNFPEAEVLETLAFETAEGNAVIYAFLSHEKSVYLQTVTITG